MLSTTAPLRVPSNEKAPTLSSMGAGAFGKEQLFPVREENGDKIRAWSANWLQALPGGATDGTRTHGLLITKCIKKRKAAISNRFAPFSLENKFRLNLFAPYPPPAPFPVWVRVWGRPDS